MKIFKLPKITILTATSLVASFLSSHAEVTFYIKQVQEGAGGEAGLSTDVYIEDVDLLRENKSSTGIHTALLNIGEYGSTFYFYVKGIDPDGPPILLDEKFVGQYVATADVEITSADPYVPVRIRADQTFNVEIKTSNQQWTSAQSNGIAPELAWDPLNVLINASYEKQDSNGSPTATGTIDLDDTSDSSITLTLVAGNTKEYNSSTSIPADVDPLDAVVPYPSYSSSRGEESIIVQAQSDTDVDGKPIYRQVASGTVQIWPLAQGKITGLTDNQSITQGMPDTTIQLYDLYPNSNTYAEIIEGPASLDGGVVPVYTSFTIELNTDKPQNRTIPVTNWDDYIKKNGQYTLQVVTKTPFNNGEPERILAVTFTVDRTVTIKGSIISSE